MPPWNVIPKTYICKYCSKLFKAKRDAKYCSPICQSRSRPKREKTSSEYNKRMRLKRLKQPGYRERVNMVANERIKRIKYWISIYKMSFGCIDCGYKVHHSALEFDHIKGNKKINVANAKSIKQAKEEISKCEVVCSNCHRIRTFERLNK